MTDLQDNNSNEPISVSVNSFSIGSAAYTRGQRQEIDDKRIEARELLEKASSLIDPETSVNLSYVDGVIPHPFPMDAMMDLNNRSVTRRACIEALATNVCKLGYTIKKLDPNAEAETTDEVSDQVTDLLEEWAGKDDESFSNLLYRVVYDVESCGNGYLEVSRDLEGNIAGLHYAPAHTIYIKADRSGYIQKVGLKKVPFYNFGDVWTINNDGSRRLNKDRNARVKELIHFKLPASGSKFYGEPRDVPAIPTYFGDEQARKQNNKFFTHGATPEVLLVFRVNPNDAKTIYGSGNLNVKIPESFKKDMENFFRRTLTSKELVPGILNLPAGVELKVERLSSEQKEAGWSKFREDNRKEIQEAFRTPDVILALSGSNYASAMAEKSVYLEQVIEPEQTSLSEKLMRRLWPEMTSIIMKNSPAVIDEEGNEKKPRQLALSAPGRTGVNHRVWKLAFNRMSILDATAQAQIDNIYGTLQVKTRNEIRRGINLKPIPGGDAPPQLAGGAEGNALAQNADMKQVASGNPDLDNFVSNLTPKVDITGIGQGRGTNGTVSIPQPRRPMTQSKHQAANLGTVGQPVAKSEDLEDELRIMQERVAFLESVLRRNGLPESATDSYTE